MFKTFYRLDRLDSFLIFWTRLEPSRVESKFRTLVHIGSRLEDSAHHHIHSTFVKGKPPHTHNSASSAASDISIEREQIAGILNLQSVSH